MYRANLRRRFCPGHKEEKLPLQDGLAAEFQQIEQELAVSQEEFAHAAENEYLPTGVDPEINDASAEVTF